MAAVKKESRPASSPPAAASSSAGAGGDGRDAGPASDAQFWLVKLPGYISKEWLAQIKAYHEKLRVDAQTPAPHLGVVKVYPKGGGAEGADLRLSVPAVEEKGMPSDLPLNTKAGPANMMLYSEHERCRVEGKIHLAVDAKQVLNEHYQNMVRSRTQQATQRVVTTKLISNEERTSGRIRQNNIIPILSAKRPREEVDEVKDKRVRLDAEAVKEMVFKAFEVKTHYTLTELIEKTNQPRAWLQEILKDICDHHLRGPTIHQYSLKAEYAVEVTPAAPMDIEPTAGVKRERQDDVKDIKK